MSSGEKFKEKCINKNARFSSSVMRIGVHVPKLLFFLKQGYLPTDYYYWWHLEMEQLISCLSNILITNDSLSLELQHDFQILPK